MKPMRATDVDPDKLKFPLMAFPKIDGVRALVIDDKLVARSGKPFKNKLNSDYYSLAEFNGFDGEMVVDRVSGDGICNETTSALTTIKGVVPTRFCLFDHVVDGTKERPYIKRYEWLCERVKQLTFEYPDLLGKLWVIPYQMVYNADELEAYKDSTISQGYEGVILRDPDAPYKYGTSTAKEGYYLRIKEFMDAEILVTGILEGSENTNEMTRSPMGKAERSTHKDNMIPNGMVGTIQGKLLDDVRYGGKVILTKGQHVEVSPGKLSHNERKAYFEDQSLIVGKIVRFQFFPVGVKDKPRFPTFQTFRDPVDVLPKNGV